MTTEQLREEYELEEMMIRNESPDETEYEDCILCCEAHDIDNMKVVNGAWVCSLCIEDNRAEGRSTYHMVLEAQDRISQRRMRIEAGIKGLKNFRADLKLITDSHKKVHA